MIHDTMHRFAMGERPIHREEPEPAGVAAEPIPCDDCPHASQCRARQLACQAFAEYVRTGRWQLMSGARLPRRQPYQRLFRD